ncbi:PREDICTED: synaptotagmin-1-like [Priapulus caudatus]|uniref:Synaptotagmin-1-like n=1 Tax=Priapulus caudatus TaxID=37621 RepID=A0ABM1DP54_PRICU|nr:PREDICTED: synaptotagmin-1-like [Priapulus caudatus]
MRLEPQAERLTITLSKAKDLPKNASGQTPNAQVKISVMQRTKQQTKESRVKKRSCHPSWKEAFSFLINVDPENLHYYTSVTVTIHDPEIGGESGVIGQVRFGQGAVQNSEIAHWKKVLQSMRKESTEWHRLMVCEDERD